MLASASPARSPAVNTHDTAPITTAAAVVRARRSTAIARRSWPRRRGPRSRGRTPMRASSTTGVDNQWPIVIATVCSPRWWLSSWASTPWSCGVGQLVDGERRDDDEVATAGEGVQLVGGQHAHHVAVRRADRSAWTIVRHSGAIVASSGSVGRRAPSIGVSTSTWNRRMKSSGPVAANAGTDQPNDTSSSRTRTATRSRTRASSVNGASRRPGRMPRSPTVRRRAPLSSVRSQARPCGRSG